MRRPPGPGTRAQQTTSALPTSSAATRSMISGSSVSTCIALASLVDPCGGGHPQELQGTANLILVLEAHATAHNTAPGARLWDGLTRPSEHDVNGWPRSIFTPQRRSPSGEVQDYGTPWWQCEGGTSGCGLLAGPLVGGGRSLGRGGPAGKE